MLSMSIPTLVVLCCLWRATASTIVLGTESGRTTLFFEFTAVITTAATATAPDATITGAGEYISALRAPSRLFI